MVASSMKHRWDGAVKQITKSNFSAALQQIKARVQDADFIAVSSQKTGDFSASSSHRYPWRRVLPIDIPETAYLKAKLAAETFELLQFAVCPFRLQGSKLVAFPYNFHLFPRDELNLGMPSYSFSCQTSFLTSMAQEGLDFNASIYDGISYLSRAQESIAKGRTSTPCFCPLSSSPSPSVADSIFMGRIKSRIVHWRNACKDPCNATDGSLAKSLRKLILGGEVYCSRPSLSIDVCSNRQVQLALEMVTHISEDLVPLVVPDKSGLPKLVRVVLTNSEEDKNLLMSEIQNLEEEQNLKIRGFREVLDLISSSHKPIIAYNCLHEFTFIHSKFLSPLPPSLSEFMCSLRLVFSNIVDVNHLLKEIGPLRKANNLPAALSYLKRQFFVPIDMEIPQQDVNSDKSHGHNVLRITRVFAKLGILLKIIPDCQTSLGQCMMPVEEYANIFYPTCNSLRESGDDDVDFHMDNVRKISTDDLIFIWGFHGGTSAPELKSHLRQSHVAFSEDFELQLVDKTCAVVVFRKSGSAEALLNEIGSGNTHSTALSTMISEGLKAAGYEAYKKVCRVGLWEADLADSLENALSELSTELTISSGEDASEIYWSSESMIDLNDL